MLVQSEIAHRETKRLIEKKTWFYPWLNEGHLWEDFKRGDRNALSCIYLHYFNVLYNYGCKMLTNKDKAKDCIQDLFVEVWQARERLSSTDSIKYYLMKALRIKVLKELKKESRFFNPASLSGEYHFDFAVPYEVELIDEQVRIERKERLSRAFERLSRRQKEIIFLRFYNDLEYTEIASIMSINYQSVHNLIFRAIKLLRKHIS
ncbi:MAG TPA: sigma-70 family RNA polymerase sigma factor [Cyclobacteriaceae bacterium]